MGLWPFGRAKADVEAASRVVVLRARDGLPMRAKVTVKFSEPQVQTAADELAETVSEIVRAIVREAPSAPALLGFEPAIGAEAVARLPKEPAAVRTVEVAGLHIVGDPGHAAQMGPLPVDVPAWLHAVPVSAPTSSDVRPVERTFDRPTPIQPVPALRAGAAPAPQGASPAGKAIAQPGGPAADGASAAQGAAAVRDPFASTAVSASPYASTGKKKTTAGAGTVPIAVTSAGAVAAPAAHSLGAVSPQLAQPAQPAAPAAQVAVVNASATATAVAAAPAATADAAARAASPSAPGDAPATMRADAPATFAPTMPAMLAQPAAIPGAAPAQPGAPTEPAASAPETTPASPAALGRPGAARDSREPFHASTAAPGAGDASPPRGRPVSTVPPPSRQSVPYGRISPIVNPRFGSSPPGPGRPSSVPRMGAVVPGDEPGAPARGSVPHGPPSAGPRSAPPSSLSPLRNAATRPPPAAVAARRRAVASRLFLPAGAGPYEVARGLTPLFRDTAGRILVAFLRTYDLTVIRRVPYDAVESDILSSLTAPSDGAPGTYLASHASEIQRWREAFGPGKLEQLQREANLAASALAFEGLTSEGVPQSMANAVIDGLAGSAFGAPDMMIELGRYLFPAHETASAETLANMIGVAGEDMPPGMDAALDPLFASLREEIAAAALIARDVMLNVQ